MTLDLMTQLITLDLIIFKRQLLTQQIILIDITNANKKPIYPIIYSYY